VLFLDAFFKHGTRKKGTDFAVTSLGSVNRIAIRSYNKALADRFAIFLEQIK